MVDTGRRTLLHIFTDRTIVPAGVRFCDALVPFWGHANSDDGYRHLASWSAFRDFEDRARLDWRLTGAADADVAVLAFDGSELLGPDRPGRDELVARARAFVDRAERAGLRTVVTVRSDSNDPLPLGDSAVVLRHSLDRRTRRANEFSLFETFAELVPAQPPGVVPPRPHTEVPVVGFCGFATSAPPTARQRAVRSARRCLDRLGFYQPERDGRYLRRRALTLLEAAPEVGTNFVLRDQPFFGTDRDEETSTSLREAYTANLLHCDYVLCVRGWGNHSVRFYEAMSLGRIPVLVDTECVLPYDFLHDYGDLCVIVPAAELHDIGRRVRAFHDRFTPETMAAHRERVRAFWEEWLSPRGFYRHLPAHWDAELAARATTTTAALVAPGSSGTPTSDRRS